METREKIRAALPRRLTQITAAGSESEARKYRRLRERYDWIECDNIDEFMHPFEESIY